MYLFGRNTLCIALFLFLLAGCDSTSNDEQAPPAMLPAEAFSLQANLFNQEDASKTSVGTHFTAAALRVWPVSLLIGANLVVPVAVTGAALQADPERDGATWTWTSTARANGEEVTFTLRGTLQGTDVNWSMRITYFDAQAQQQLDDFELYTAQTDISGQTGSWQLYYLINGESRNVLNADFVVPGETEVTITYSVPSSAERSAGDSVRYERDGNAYVFLWQQVEEAMEHDVTWEATTRIGSITASNYNGGQKGCWDEALNNTACSN